MKVNFYVSFCFMMIGCKTPVKIEAPKTSVTDPHGLSLVNTEFWDGIVFMGEGTDAHSFIYNFETETYEIKVYRHYEPPHINFIVESGYYKLDNNKLTLFPALEITCPGEFMINSFPCVHIYDSSSFYVSKDSIPDKDLAVNGLSPRSFDLWNSNGKLSFLDEKISEILRIKQLIK